jgi:8-oxo-dGTP pyrophosphatase MutT (NUDIX family)
MHTLVKVDREIPWLPRPSEGRLYITDELPPLEFCGTAFGFAFDGDRVLLTRLRDRDWDIPGGRIEAGETPDLAAVREIWEETRARVEIIDMIGIQELVLLGPRPPNYRWGYPLTVQVYYRVRILELAPFEYGPESLQRGFFSPRQARRIPSMDNHDAIYEEALARTLK